MKQIKSKNETGKMNSKPWKQFPEETKVNSPILKQEHFFDFQKMDICGSKSFKVKSLHNRI